jgi:hypothetical protein
MGVNFERRNHFDSSGFVIFKTTSHEFELVPNPQVAGIKSALFRIGEGNSGFRFFTHWAKLSRSTVPCVDAIDRDFPPSTCGFGVVRVT